MSQLPERRRRHAQDRRRQPTGVWGAFRFGSQRLRNRRADDRCRPHFVDRFSATTLALVLLMLAFTIVDGIITLDLVDVECQEINPAMRYLLSKGPVPFLLGKYLLTAAGIPVLLIFRTHFLFHTRFRVGYFIPVFVILYAVLTIYQIQLLVQATATAL